MQNSIERSIHLKAPIARVWSALTDHREFGEWFGVHLDRPFKPGETVTGKIKIQGFEHVQFKVHVKDIKPKELFAFTWLPFAVDKDRDYSGETPTRVEFRLEDLGGETRLSVTESGFEHVPADRRAEAFRMNSGGWTAQMENIRKYVDAQCC